MFGRLPDGKPVHLNRDDELSLREAALHFTASITTLRRLLQAGQLWGYKVRGVHGEEWRVTVAALHEVGCIRRSGARDTSPEVAELRRALHALAGVLVSERRRADENDRKLGAARMEIIRLRARLQRAGFELD